MSRTCKNCNSKISDEHKFCTKCGTKIEEKVEEEIIANDSQSNQNKKENIPNYNKIGGFLIFIGIMLVLGLLGTLTFFNENYTNEYYESLSTFYESNNELFTLLNISYYLTVICLFLLILLNISFFRKSNITKKLAIIYFTLLIITDIYGVYIFLDNKEIISKLYIEIVKMAFQIVSASLFIIYFSISKRVKETFIEEKNFKLHIVIASIVPIILFLYYSDKLNEIKNVSLEEEIIKNKSNVQSNNYSSDTSSSVENKESLDNNNISKIDTNEEIKKEKNTTKNQSHKWKYKDWEIENIDDNFIKAFTIGKNRADVFTIIKKKEDCKPSFLYTTTHLFDKSIQVNKNDILKMDIKVDNELFNSDTAIYEIFDLRFVKQLMSTPYPLYESFIEKLKNGNTIQTTVFSPILKDIDITPNEEYSLNGFTKTYNVLNEACRDINALNRYKEVNEIKNVSFQEEIIKNKSEYQTNIKEKETTQYNYAEVNDFLLDWDNAHNNKDFNLFSKLYSDFLNYYKSNNENKLNSIKDKERILKKYPDFKQKSTLVNIEVLNNNLKIYYSKNTYYKKKERIFTSYLIIARENETFKILEENDY